MGHKTKPYDSTQTKRYLNKRERQEALKEARKALTEWFKKFQSRKE